MDKERVLQGILLIQKQVPLFKSKELKQACYDARDFVKINSPQTCPAVVFNPLVLGFATGKDNIISACLSCLHIFLTINFIRGKSSIVGLSPQTNIIDQIISLVAQCNNNPNNDIPKLVTNFWVSLLYNLYIQVHGDALEISLNCFADAHVLLKKKQDIDKASKDFLAINMFYFEKGILEEKEEENNKNLDEEVEYEKKRLKEIVEMRREETEHGLQIEEEKLNNEQNSSIGENEGIADEKDKDGETDINNEKDNQQNINKDNDIQDKDKNNDSKSENSDEFSQISDQNQSEKEFIEVQMGSKVDNIELEKQNKSNFLFEGQELNNSCSDALVILRVLCNIAGGGTSWNDQDNDNYPPQLKLLFPQTLSVLIGLITHILSYPLQALISEKIILLRTLSPLYIRGDIWSALYLRYDSRVNEFDHLRSFIEALSSIIYSAGGSIIQNSINSSAQSLKRPSFNSGNASSQDQVENDDRITIHEDSLQLFGFSLWAQGSNETIWQNLKKKKRVDILVELALSALCQISVSIAEFCREVAPLETEEERTRRKQRMNIEQSNSKRELNGKQNIENETLQTKFNQIPGKNLEDILSKKQQKEIFVNLFNSNFERAINYAINNQLIEFEDSDQMTNFSQSDELSNTPKTEQTHSHSQSEHFTSKDIELEQQPQIPEYLPKQLTTSVIEITTNDINEQPKSYSDKIIQSISDYILSQTLSSHSIQPKILGMFLGQKEQLNNDIFKSIVSKFYLKGLDVYEALCLFLGTVRVGSQPQQVYRNIEILSTEYHKQNPESFPSPQESFFFFYSAMQVHFEAFGGVSQGAFGNPASVSTGYASSNFSLNSSVGSSDAQNFDEFKSGSPWKLNSKRAKGAMTREVFIEYGLRYGKDLIWLNNMYDRIRKNEIIVLGDYESKLLHEGLVQGQPIFLPYLLQPSTNSTNFSIISSLGQSFSYFGFLSLVQPSLAISQSVSNSQLNLSPILNQEFTQLSANNEQQQALLKEYKTKNREKVLNEMRVLSQVLLERLIWRYISRKMTRQWQKTNGSNAKESRWYEQEQEQEQYCSVSVINRNNPQLALLNFANKPFNCDFGSPHAIKILELFTNVMLSFGMPIVARASICPDAVAGTILQTTATLIRVTSVFGMSQQRDALVASLAISTTLILA
ncbi:MAG: hypothetical protein EZS28_000536 [Streblomastix strix]|uniref:SEC7 domain-containing protein n=1 Tax=Streblomastix strix TaxID=222440 RepID=A0A5J4XBP3_9EUKA|nr:MAG: hypothetical protein EZS28_000536 [Streblomastix strix]